MTAFTAQSSSPVIKPLQGVVTGIGAGQVATCRLPPGLTYAEIIVRCTIAGVAATRAQLETMLTTARLTISGVEKFSVQAIDLIAIAEFYRTGCIGDSGYFVIPFERLWNQGVAAQLDPNYGTEGESSVVLELTQDGASTIDAINVFARVNPKAEVLGAHVILRRFTFNVSATGKFLYPDLPIIPGEYLNALHIRVPVVANLTNIALITDDVRFLDVPPSLLTQLYQLANPVRTPQTAKLYVSVDFANRGYDSDTLPVGLLKSQVLELEFANAAPNAVTVIGEYGTVSRRAA
jgi:hypothetical protein